MKMTSSTSSTSIMGVTFMSQLACRRLAPDDLVGSEMVVCVRHY